LVERSSSPHELVAMMMAAQKAEWHKLEGQARHPVKRYATLLTRSPRRTRRRLFQHLLPTVISTEASNGEISLRSLAPTDTITQAQSEYSGLSRQA